MEKGGRDDSVINDDTGDYNSSVNISRHNN